MKLHLSKEALQSLHSARQSVEKAIREAKALIHQPHGPGSGASIAQAQLVRLKKEATLIYTALAASRGKLHCPASEERIEALRNLHAKRVPLTPLQMLILGLPWPELKPSIAA